MSTAVKSIGTAEGPSLSEIRAQNAQFAEEVGKLHEKLQLAYAGMSQFAGASKEIGTTSVRAGVDIEGLSASMGKIAGRANAMLEVAGSVAAVGQALHSSSAQAENLRTRLDLATGGKGAQEMAYITALADRLGLQLGTTGQAYADFATKARGTALEGAQVQTIFSGIATASAAMGLSSEKGSASLSAVLELMGQGAISASDFSDKLGYIPNAALIGAQALGVTQEHFTAMLQAGEVVAQDFLPRFAQALQSSLGDGVDQAASRLEAGTNRMGSAWDKLKTAVGDSGISQMITVGMNAAANDMNSFSESITRARDNGSGFLGQISSGLGVLAGRAVGLNYLSMGFQSNAEKAATLARELPRARAELEALQAKGAATSRNVWVRSAHGDAQRLVEKLQQAQKELMAIQGQRSAGGGRGFINPSLVGQGSTENKGTEKPTQKKETPASRSVNYVVPRAPAQPSQDSERLQREQEEKKRAQELAQLLKDQQSKAQIAEKNLELAQQETEAIGLTGEALGKLRQKQIEKTVADIEDKATKEEGIRCSKEMAEAVGKEAKATRELALVKDYNESARMVSEYAKSVKESSDALQFEQSLTAVSQRDRQIALEQYKIEIELRKKLEDIAAKNPEGSQEAQALKDKATQAASLAKANVAERARMVETQKAVDQMDEMFRKGFADMLIGGEGTWKAFTRNLATSFKTTVADELYKSFAQPFIVPVVAHVQGMINGVIQAGANALGLGGGGSLSGLASGASSIYSLTTGKSILGQAAGWLGLGSAATTGAATGMVAGVGSGFSIGSTAVATGLKAGLGATGSFVGGGGLGMVPSAAATNAIGGGIGGSLSAAGGSAAAGTGGLSGAIAAIPGWGWAAAAVAALAIGGTFTSRGANHSGGAYSTGTDDRNTAAGQALGADAWGNALGDITTRANTEIDKQLVKTVNALSDVYASLAKYAGDSARDIDIAAAFAVNSKHGDEDNYGYFRILDKVTGEALATYKQRDGGLGNDPQKAYAQFVADMGGALVQQLKAADIPSWMRGVFDGLGEDITAEGLSGAVQKIAVLDTSLKSMTRNLAGFGSLADSTFTALLKNSGGVEKLNAGISSYYANFYTDAERTANVSRDVKEALAEVGIEMPRTREEFRALVEANIALGDGGAKTVSAMLGVSEAFASVVPAAAKASEAVSQAMQGLLDDRPKLQAELLRAGGDEAGSQAALRDIATMGYTDAEKAAWDYNNALRQQINALDEAAQLQKSLAEATGTAQKSAAQVVQQLIEGVSSAASFRANLGSSIESTRLQTMSAGDQASYLRGKEGRLWEQLSTSQDPAAVAQQLQQTIVDRIGIEAKLREDLDGTTLSGLQQQLGVAQSMRSAASSMQQSVNGLRLGNTSALNPLTQLQYAADKFDAAYQRALGGDVSAWQDVQSMGQTYVQLGRDVYASSTDSADVFSRVTGAMDQLVAMGMGADPQITALNTQIELLQSLGTANEQSAWVAQQQLASFERLDDVMRQQQERLQEQAETQISLMRQSVEELSRQNELLQSQILQQAQIATDQAVRDKQQLAVAAAAADSAKMAEAQA